MPSNALSTPPPKPVAQSFCNLDHEVMDRIFKESLSSLVKCKLVPYCLSLVDDSNGANTV